MSGLGEVYFEEAASPLPSRERARERGMVVALITLSPTLSLSRARG